MAEDLTLLEGGQGEQGLDQGDSPEVREEDPGPFQTHAWWKEGRSDPTAVEPPRADRGLKRVAVQTDFYTIDRAYSLATVAGNQIKMLLRHGYDPLVLVDEHIQEDKLLPPWNQVRLFKLPSIPRSNRAELPKEWEKHLDRMTDAMREGLQDIDVVLSHDLIFQPAQILYNMAARAITDERAGSLHWLHWIHSATPPELINAQTQYLQAIKLAFPHAYVVFPNAYSRARVANNFNYAEADVKFVPHPIDIPEFMRFHPLTRELVDQYDMLGAEFVGIYPARLDRGKQVEFCIRIFAQLKKIGRSVRLVIADFHSTGGDKVLYRRELIRMGSELGLSADELIFMSQWKKETNVTSPRELIADIMQISTVYIHPSRSETYSLTAQEAALCGAILVLNFDFPPMRSLYGEEPLYMKFGSNIDTYTGQDGDTNVKYNDGVDAWCGLAAREMIAELGANSALTLKTRLRMTRNLDSVFRRHLEPLLYSWG